MNSKIVKVLSVLVLVLLSSYILPKDIIQVSAGEKVHVVDGDSLELGEKRIRLLGIDSPEYRQFCYNAKHQKYDCGIEAKRYLEDLIGTQQVRCEEESKDIYERSLSVCFAGDVNLNAEMIRAGWALPYREEGDKYLSLEKQAKVNKKGVWQGRFMRPELYRFLNKRKNS
ncbi:MAG: thermonuclease family protein [Alphaproteobacteria bacterium]|nr:thermonuclease family protein [Alphaproteobacteria bacterium]